MECEEWSTVIVSSSGTGHVSESITHHPRFAFVRVSLLVPLAVLCLVAVSRFCSAQDIIAHRGASHDAPENTLAAFRLAWEQQADGIEGDFHLTRDRQIVCIHDATTERVAPDSAPLKVAESTLAELRQLDVGSWKDPKYAGERIPTLREVLQTVPPGKRIFVEIKSGPEILPILKDHLEESGLDPEQILIICFQRDVVTQSRRKLPHYKVNWLTSYKQDPQTGAWKPDRHEVLRTLATTGVTGLGTNGNVNVIDRSFVDDLRAAGKEFHVWTINEEAPARVFQSMGADSITTDRPAFIRKSLSPRDDSDS